METWDFVAKIGLILCKQWLQMMRRLDIAMIAAAFSPCNICEHHLQEIKPVFANKFQSFQHLAHFHRIYPHLKLYLTIFFWFGRFSCNKLVVLFKDESSLPGCNDRREHWRESVQYAWWRDRFWVCYFICIYDIYSIINPFRYLHGLHCGTLTSNVYKNILF